MNDTVMTVVGNLAADPELKYLPSGAAVANLTVMSTPRTFDKASNEWKDAEPLAVRCAAWRDLGEHVAESLTRGARVIAQGRWRARSFETREGEKRTAWDLELDAIGPDLRYATASVVKAARNGATGNGQAPARVGGDDPWASAPAGASSGTSYDDEPPF